jgi:A/G-specific adenine glycosylase
MALLAGLPGPFLDWYGKKARALPWRQTRRPYPVWLSEIMLQQTRVEAVKGYYERFLAALPDIETLAAASEETVFKLWEGLGYYRRARNLHQAAKILVAGSRSFFPSDYEGILALPGIGEYTAGAVASICFGIPKPAVDGNVLRVVARLFDSDEAVDQLGFKKKIAKGLETVMAAGAFDPGDFNQSLMEIGAMVCLPKGLPRCGQCPARCLCRSHASGRAELLPVRRIKKSRLIEEKTVLILLRPGAGDTGDTGDTGEETALRRRRGQGLLAGLWELPNVPGRLAPDEAMRQAAAWGVKPVKLERASERVHVFSHVKWLMTGYWIRCDTAGDETGALQWTTPEERRQAYALPTAFRQFLEEG